MQRCEYRKGDNISQTATKLIAMQPLPKKSQAKLDLKVPYDWGYKAVSFPVELQSGRSFSPASGLYVGGLARPGRG